MLKTIKYTLLSLSALLLILIISAVLVLLFVDPNDYKEQVTDAIYQRSGREVSIGNISWTFFPNVALQLSNVSINNLPGFDTKSFAQFGEADIRVKLLPLFRGSIEAKKISIKNSQLHLMRNKQGKINWAMTPKSKSAAVKVTTSEISKPTHNTFFNQNSIHFTLNEIDSQDAIITWIDEKNNENSTIELKSLQVGNVNNNNIPFKLASNIKLTDNNRALIVSLNTNSKVQINHNLTQLSFKNFNLFGNVSGENIALKRWDLMLNSDIIFDMSKKSYTASNLTAKINTIVSQGEIKGYYGAKTMELSGNLTINPFNLKNLFKSVGVKLTTNHEHALTKVQGKINFDLTKDKLAVTLFDGIVDESQINGKFNINKFGTKFALTINQFDTKNYLPIKVKDIVPAVKSGAKKLKAVHKEKELLPKPTVVSEVVNPFSKFEHYDIDGQVELGKLRFGKLQLQNVNSNISSHHGIMTLETKQAEIYQGDFHGKMIIDFQQYPPQYSIIENFSEIQMQPFLSDLIRTKMISGTGQLAVTMTTEGHDMQSIKQALDGNGHFDVQNGVIKGLDLMQLVKLAYGKFKRKNLVNDSSTQETSFSNLMGTVKIENGIVTNNDLRLSSPSFNLTGKGSVNLITEEIDYTIEIVLIDEEFPQLYQFVQEAGGSIPFKVTGTLDKLKFEPNIPELFKRIAEKKLGKTFDDINVQFKDFNQQMDKASKELGKQLKSLFKN